MTWEFIWDTVAHYRDSGMGCLGTYRSVRIAIGPIYISLAWRVKR